MANFFNGKYILSNSICTSKECLRGQFDKCPKKHQYLIRSSAVNEKETTPTASKKNESADQVENESQDEKDVETIYNEQFDADFQLQDNSTCFSAEDIEYENDANEIIISDSESEMDEHDSVIVYTAQLARDHPEYNIVMQFVHGDLLLNDFFCDIKSWEMLFQSIGKSKRNSVIGYIGSVGIRLNDLETLDNDNWLNDRIINSFMLLLQEKSLRSEKSIEVVDTFWLSHYQVIQTYHISKLYL